MGKDSDVLEGFVEEDDDAFLVLEVGGYEDGDTGLSGLGAKG